MKEISLHILDIAKNSIRAGASLVGISLVEDDTTLTLTIRDDGCGMDEELLASVKDPFSTTRTTRKVGLGIPLLTMAAGQTGGFVDITSETGENHGTTLVAKFYTNHIDCMPIGNMPETVATLIQGSPQIDFEFLHVSDRFRVSLDTRQLREILGEEIPLSSPEILLWISQYLEEQYENLSN